MENGYPKYLYHADCDALLVKDEKQHRALGQGWAESPGEAEVLKNAGARKPHKGKAQSGGDA